ncbi:MAG: RNA polymerase factor sigma-54 [bacterium]|nr:RNA polymerase factor sigma-54 [bacterium]
MAIRLEQSQRQIQKLIMSPQMQQAIRLLQLPLLQLQQVIRQEMTQNPVLEEDLQEEEQQEIERQETADEGSTAAGDQDELSFEEEFSRLAAIDDEWREYFRQSGSHRKYSEEDEERRRFLEASIVKPETLQENLLDQIGPLLLDERERRICEALIGNIDDNGYLQSDVAEIARSIGEPEADVERMLSLVRTLSPVGVGARNVRECLLIQLDRLGKRESLAARIVEGHLEELGARKYSSIARALKVSPAQVHRAADLIATLDPKPGRVFSVEQAQYITPDVFIEKDRDGYTVILNDDRIPHLRISNLYRKLISAPGTDKGDRSYIREKIKNGQWLIRNIRQRQHTISNIAGEIVRRQRGFMEEGPSRMKPLTMQEVADALGIHESTVSRAIAGKYAQTPHGLYDMKYFFSTGISTAGGDAVAANAIKGMIGEIIGRENPKEPLSDQQVIDLLKGKGIALARRTVTKYRKELGIPPSSRRRSF